MATQGRDDAVKVAPSETALDIVIFTDMRFPGGSASRLSAEVRAAVDGGYRVGIAHIASPRLSRYSPVSSHLSKLIEDGLAHLVLPGEPVNAALAIVHHPLPFRDPIGAILPVATDMVIVTAAQAPADIDGTVYYKAVEVDRNITAAFGVQPSWHPVSPAVRSQLQDVPCAADNWIETIDTADWRPTVAGRDNAAPASTSVVTIGRHSRPDPLKWPRDAPELIASYPIDGSVNVRVLGGAGPAVKVLGSIPISWHVVDFGGQDPAEFLQELDVYIYHHHPNLVEAFPRNVLEALAVGIPVIVPPHFETIYGEACTYATPAETPGLVQRLTHDRQARQDQIARADKILHERWSPDVYRAKIATLIGPPRTKQPTATSANPSLDAIPATLRKQFTTSLITCLGADQATVEQVLRDLDRHRRHAPGTIPIVVVTIKAPDVATDLGIPIHVITSRHNWASHENWNDYAIRRVKQIARHHNVDYVAPHDVTSDDAWISLQTPPAEPVSQA